MQKKKPCKRAAQSKEEEREKWDIVKKGSRKIFRQTLRLQNSLTLDFTLVCVCVRHMNMNCHGLRLGSGRRGKRATLTVKGIAAP